jgi:hypothetical protein
MSIGNGSSSLKTFAGGSGPLGDAGNSGSSALFSSALWSCSTFLGGMLLEPSVGKIAPSNHDSPSGGRDCAIFTRENT